MSMINVSMDTKTNEITLSIDGESFDGVKSVMIDKSKDYCCDDDEEKLHIHAVLESPNKGEDSDLKHRMIISNASSKQGKELSRMDDKKFSKDGSIVIASDSPKLIANEIGKLLRDKR